MIDNNTDKVIMVRLYIVNIYMLTKKHKIYARITKY